MSRVLSIAAPASGSGKTSLMVTLLRAHPGIFTALKAITVYKDGRKCPRAGADCACRRLEGDYVIVSDPHVIAQPDTDTGRMVRAGAARTLWCLARPGAHERMWSHLEGEILEPGETILAEGSKAIEVMKPEAIVMVINPDSPRERWKESAWPLMARASLVIVNERRGAGGREAAARVASEISRRVHTHVQIQDVARPLGEWGDATLSRLCGSVIGASSPPVEKAAGAATRA